jgi:hypothetical protein
MRTTKIRDKEPKSPKRKPGAWKGKIWISPDFDKADKEIEALFYDSPIEPPTSGKR